MGVFYFCTMVDFIIVGFGLAGMSFADQLEEHNKSYVVFDNDSQRSSRVAGGLYNPVILKRFTLAWKAEEQLAEALPLYNRLQQQFNTEITYELPVLRRFNSVEEQNTWAEAYDKPTLQRFLTPQLVDKNTYAGIDALYHYGKVKNTGRVEIVKMLDAFKEKLTKRNAFFEDGFEYNALEINANEVVYKGIKAKYVVFAEGYGLKQNPFFNELPLTGNKGEYLIIKSEALKLKEAVKSAIFIIPLGDNLYKVGATYNHDDKTLKSTIEAREELEKGIRKIIKVPFQVVDQMAGVRPTVLDRRPLVGRHAKYPNLHILNGLGTRGILIGPTVAKALYQNIANDIPLDKEINIKRFEDRTF